MLGEFGAGGEGFEEGGFEAFAVAFAQGGAGEEYSGVGEIFAQDVECDGEAEQECECCKCEACLAQCCCCSCCCR